MKSTPTPGQEEMFARSAYSTDEVPVIHSPSVTPAFPIEETESPSTDVADRAVYLQSTLDELSQASRLSGLANMSATPEGRRQLEQRYDDVDTFLGNSEASKNDHELNAKIAFVRATGHYALLEAVGSEESKKITSDMYNDFVQKYADAKGSKSRKKFKRQLKKQQETQVSIRGSGN